MRVKTSARWFYHAPGMVYAVDFRFDQPVGKRTALRFIRERLGYQRLPKGHAVWPAR